MFDTLELKKEPGIYIFTNKINGKKYVGESVNIKQRFYTYKTPKPDRPFTRALLKYGSSGFDIKIIYFPGISKNDLLDLEETFIFLESSLVEEHGYNLLKRGTDRSGFKHTEETKLKMSCSHNGMVRSKSHRENIAKARIGTSHSVDTVLKMTDNMPKKTVLQFSKELELINEYVSGWEASRQTGINQGHISSCCNGNKKSIGGFFWIFKD